MIVEGVKTAIVGRLLRDDVLWLATATASLGMKELKDVMPYLKRHIVYCLPDTNSYGKWRESNFLLNRYSNIVVSDVMQKMDLPKNYDLADFVIKENNIEKAQDVIYQIVRTQNPNNR